MDLNGFATDGIASGKRKWSVRTGKKGQDMLHHAIEVESAIGMVLWLVEREIITPERG